MSHVSQVYVRCIPGVSQVYPRCIPGVSQVYPRCVWGLSGAHSEGDGEVDLVPHVGHVSLSKEARQADLGAVCNTKHHVPLEMTPF